MACDVLGNDDNLVHVPMSLQARTSALDGWLQIKVHKKVCIWRFDDLTG